MSVSWLREVIIPIGPSIAYVPLTRGQFALIDPDEAPIIGRNNWLATINKGTGKFYATRTRSRLLGKKTSILMHRQIMGFPEGLDVDHLHGNTLDNRRSQLREATRSENNFNTAARNTNKSGFKGVSWCKRDSKWKAQICVNNKRKMLGRYITPEEAHAAYANAAKKYHGEFARVA